MVDVSVSHATIVAMLASHPIDGSLASWRDIESSCAWSALLLGNGLSMHVWSGFAYGSLF